MMSECFGKVKYTKNSIDYYKQLKKLIIEIDLNEIVKEIIEKKRIPMEMKFIFNDKQKESLNRYKASKDKKGEKPIIQKPEDFTRTKIYNLHPNNLDVKHLVLKEKKCNSFKEKKPEYFFGGFAYKTKTNDNWSSSIPIIIE